MEVLGKMYTELFSAMRPRPWLLLCVSLHGVAASVYSLTPHALPHSLCFSPSRSRHPCQLSRPGSSGAQLLERMRSISAKARSSAPNRACSTPVTALRHFYLPLRMYIEVWIRLPLSIDMEVLGATSLSIDNSIDNTFHVHSWRSHK